MERFSAFFRSPRDVLRRVFCFRLTVHLDTTATRLSAHTTELSLQSKDNAPRHAMSRKQKESRKLEDKKRRQANHENCPSIRQIPFCFLDSTTHRRNLIRVLVCSPPRFFTIHTELPSIYPQHHPNEDAAAVKAPTRPRALHLTSTTRIDALNNTQT